MNYYSIFGFNKDKFTKEKLDIIYKRYLNDIEERLEKCVGDEKRTSELKKMEDELTMAYSILSNDEKRKEHDEYLRELAEIRLGQNEETLQQEDKENESDRELVEEKEFITKFEKNQILRYRPSLIKKLKFFKTEDKAMEYLDREKGRRIVIEEVGTLEFETAFNVKYPDLKRYRITVKDILEGKIETYKIFTSFSKLQFLQNDEYADFLGTVLFSDENLKIASKYNGGYVGEIQEKDNQVKVIHNEDYLSAAIEFNKRLRGAVNRTDIKNNPKVIDSNEEGR